MASNTARSAVTNASKKLSNDPWKYHVKDKSAFWEKFRRAVVVNPDSNNGLIDVREHRWPGPGGREEIYAKPSSKASDIAGNPYWQRDNRRQYPQTSAVTQEYLTELLIAAPDRAEAIGLPPPSIDASASKALTTGSAKPTLAALYPAQEKSAATTKFYSPSKLPCVSSTTQMPIITRNSPAMPARYKHKWSLGEESPVSADVYWPQVQWR